MTPYREPPPDETSISILGALEGLANHLGVPEAWDIAAARAALRISEHEHPGPLRETWAERLLRGGEALGLRLSRLSCTPRMIIDGLTPESSEPSEPREPADALREVPLPALALTRTGLVLLTERQGRRVRVTQPESIGEPAALYDAGGLAALLGAADANTAIPLVLATPAAPLMALRDPDLPRPAIGAHDHDGHDHDGHDRGGHGAHGSHLSPQRRLWALMRSEANDLWVVLVYAIAVGVLSLATPIAVQALVNSVAFGALLQPLLVVTLLLLAGLSISGVLRALQTFVVEVLQQRLFVRTALDLAYRLPRLRRDAFAGTYGPEMVNRFFDVVTVQKSTAGLLLDGLSLVLQAVIGMILLAFYHPALLAFDIVLLVAIAIILVPLGRGAVDSAIRESRAKYAVAGWLEELVRHPLVFRGAEGGSFAVQHADDLARHYLVQRRAHFRVLLRQIIGSLGLYALAAAALLGIGGALVIARQLTIGQLVAAELLVGAVLSSFAKFGKQLESYYDLLAAIDKLGHLVDLPLEPGGGEPVPPGGGPARLDLRGVRLFSPEATADEAAATPEAAAALPLTLHVRPGARVAVFGHEGSGKSTLGEVLYGLRQPAAGLVELDGVELPAARLGSLRAQAALLRGIEIFDGTIAENVVVGRRDLDPAAVRAALHSVGLRELVARLPQGLHTPIHDAASLSHGQAVRLMIARAIVGRPRLLIVDDTLSGLDPQAREQLLDVLCDPGAPWTLLVLSREDQPDLLRRCDQVVRLEGGTLRRTPTPSDAAGHAPPPILARARATAIKLTPSKPEPR